MGRRIISGVTLAAFLVFSWSCAIYGWKPNMPQAIKPEKRAAAKISAVQLKSGQKVEFNRHPPARIQGDSIVGAVLSTVLLERSRVKKPKRISPGIFPEILTDDGTVYRDHAIIKIYRKQIVIGRYVPLSVPLKEVDLVWVKKVDALGTALLYIVPIGAAVVLFAVAASGMGALMPDFSGLSMGGCCLLIYSYDGLDFACDAEPFAGAIAQGLERTEWSRLDHCREVDGRYRLLGSNGLEETQHLDELKIVAVDHAPGVRVVPDIAGGFHTVSQPLPPRLALDGRGANITELLSGDDEVLWTSRPDEKTPAQGGALKEELLIEFPRPAGADRVKVIVDARTSLLGSFSAKRFLELYGRALPAWYAELDNHGPAYPIMNSWLLNEELYRLQIRVETKDGWKTKGLVYGGGPFVSKEKAYPLDIRDVPGDVLRVRLTPAVGFWLIDSVMADYSADLPVQTRELTAAKAVDRDGRDVRGEISQTDQEYFVMPVRGDTAEFVFDAPPRAAGLERTLLLKASGYYKAHLIPEGEPRWDIIAKFIGEPGFTVRYAWSEFERWTEAIAILNRPNEH